MSFLDAAQTVPADAAEPLHYREITERALARGLVVTKGLTPADTMSAQLSTHIIRQGDASLFMRTKPGVFALTVWGMDPEPVLDLKARTVRVPSWQGLRGLLMALHGRPADHVTQLRVGIRSMKGDGVDYSQPKLWVPEHLQSPASDLALDIWRHSSGALNPRYIGEPVGLAHRYDLVEEDDNGVLHITQAGRDFVDNPVGTTANALDLAEGVARVLAIVAEHGPERSSALLEPFTEWCRKHTALRAESTLRAGLASRLSNLEDRGLVVRSGLNWTATANGLERLGREPEALVDDAADQDKDELFDLVREINEQQQRVRSRIRAALYKMDPYAFEHLIKRLLDEMGYDDVEVTKASNDKGIDVVGRIQVGITSVTEVIQAKRQKGNVGRPVLDGLRGSLYRWSAQRGTIITTASFSKGARSTAFDVGAAPIQLIDGDTLVDLLVTHGIGVKQQPVKLWRYDAEAFTAPVPEPGLDDGAE